MIARDLGANNREFLSRAGFLALPQPSRLRGRPAAVRSWALASSISVCSLPPSPRPHPAELSLTPVRLREWAEGHILVVIGGTSTVLVLLIGFMALKEPFSWLELFSVALIAAGVFLLQRKGLS